MINYLWGLMIIISVVYAALTGRIAEVSDAAVESGKEAVELCISMLGVMAMWTGLMQVAKAGGLLDKFTKGMYPVVKWLFPDIPKDHIAIEHISTNMIANILGLGWAATPFGLKAMKELQKINLQQGGEKGTASRSMCTFLILNISSLQIIPVNIIAYRSQYGSVKPAQILMPAILATLTSSIAAVIFVKLAGRKRRSV